MDLPFSEYANIVLRWFHIFAGILWIGSTWYFTWLDFKVRDAVAKGGDGAPVWLVHSGGFYKVQRVINPGIDPRELHWFKWNALSTWISGVLLLGLVSWMGGSLVEPEGAPISEGAAIGLAVACMVGGWGLYDTLWKYLFEKQEQVGAVVGYLLSLALAWVLLKYLAPRAAYVHVGAVFGTLMVANVWLRILPAQTQMVRAIAEKREPDQALAARAKLRSKHNTFLIVPVVFTMISNHYPTSTYGTDHPFAALAVLILAGWVVAGLVRGKV